jgi:ABC-type Na+ efflux pump permease subunit
MYDTVAKILIALGVLLILIGVILLIFGKIGLLGKLPGDIHVHKKNLEFHFPIVTCIIISILLSLLLTAFFKWYKK